MTSCVAQPAEPVMHPVPATGDALQLQQPANFEGDSAVENHLTPAGAVNKPLFVFAICRPTAAHGMTARDNHRNARHVSTSTAALLPRGTVQGQ